MNVSTIMTTDADRFVTPTLTMADFPSARRLGVHIPTLDDDSIVQIELSPLAHRFNYPAVPGGYAANGVLLEFDFDDADGTTITDRANNVVLSEQGDPTFQASAAVAGLGNGVTFDGTVDAFDCLVQDIPHGVLPTTGDFSVEIVCKWTSGNFGDTLIACRDGSGGLGWQLSHGASADLYAHIEDEDSAVVASLDADPATDTIRHFCSVCDRDGNAVVYDSGVPTSAGQSIAAVEKSVRPPISADSRLSIGGDAARTANDCITGTIYFVRLYNRVLPAAEIIRNAGVLLGTGNAYGWKPLHDVQDGTVLQIAASASDPGYFDLTPYIGALTGNAFRVRCATEQTTTPTDLDFVWSYS